MNSLVFFVRFFSWSKVPLEIQGSVHLLRIFYHVLALKSSIGREAVLTGLIGFGGRRDDETPLHLQLQEPRIIRWINKVE